MIDRSALTAGIVALLPLPGVRGEETKSPIRRFDEDLMLDFRFAFRKHAAQLKRICRPRDKVRQRRATARREEEAIAGHVAAFGVVEIFAGIVLAAPLQRSARVGYVHFGALDLVAEA